MVHAKGAVGQFFAFLADAQMKKEWILEKIGVECYSGYRGEESPRAFFHLGKRFEIHEILDRWYEEGRTAPALRYEYFKVKTMEGGILLLRHTPADQTWELCRIVPAPRFSDQ